jgi:RNA polymerase sigma-70 factor (ECF subfamily)
LDDLEAIQRMKNGDIGGLAALVERYQVKALRTAFLITQNQALAEDVVQAAFLRIYRRIGQFDITRPFAPWFMRAVVNAAVQASQKQQRHISLDDDDAAFSFDALPDMTPGPDGALEAAELKQAVWEALQKLPPDQRAAIVMRYYLDFSEAEMSAALNSPPGTVKWRLHTARKQLRVLLYRLSRASEWSEV